MHFGGLRVAALTCEPVLTEACFLLRRARPGADLRLLDIVSTGRLLVAFNLGAEAASVSALMSRYANVPMSLADACLVRMTEIHPTGRVLTLDGDFRVYRKNGREAIDAVAPVP